MPNLREFKEKELERVLKALGNRRRISLVSYIRDRREATVGDLAHHLHLSFKATSKHLLLLAHAHILEREQRGPNVLYRLSSDLPEAARRVLSLF